MSPETKNCQNCKQNFTIESEDFVFYEKIKVPPPTFCPECRFVRRLVWRNNRSLYRRECMMCSKTIISMYPNDGVPVMCTECYQGDSWDQFEYQQEIDWSRNLFEQIYSIFKKQPRIYQYRIGTVINSDYGNSIVNTKDAYLSYSIIDCDNVLYSESLDKSRDSVDCFLSQGLSQCYWNIGSEKNYNSHFVVQSQTCIDSYFIFDCVNCQNCCFSSNLRNKQYYFNNQQLTKEAYIEAVRALNLDTVSGFKSATEYFSDIVKNSIHRYAQILSSENATGDFISNSKSIHSSFDVTQSCENIAYSCRMINAKDCYDCYAILTGELEYETMSGSGNVSNQIGCFFSLGSQNVEYSLFCKSCSYCFACVGLKSSKYCILNKQYSKEEYEILVPKLRKLMMDIPYVDSMGRLYRYGEFYPYEFSPFSYNESLVQDYFPLSKEKALSAGFKWKDNEKRIYQEAISSDDIPDFISGIDDSFLSKTIICSHKGVCEYQCTEVFKITKQELDFYIQKKLPLPLLCPNCRHYDRLKYRNPIKLYKRECLNGCGTIFETTYAPTRPERVYCEKCYQKEVL